MFQPMPLRRIREPFSHPDWIFEVKWDGFRSLALVDHGECKLISRKGNDFKSFPALNEAIPRELLTQSAVLELASPSVSVHQEFLRNAERCDSPSY